MKPSSDKKWWSRPLLNQKGMALLMAITTIMLMSFIALEVSYDTNVEYLVASQEVNRLKAYYAARAGVDISLLRISIYKQVMGSFGSQLGDNKSMLDPIWAFPFAWPPVLPDELSGVDKEMIGAVVKESSMQGQYLVTIEPEGGKIDINDLGSPLASLQKATQAQVMKIFESEMKHNEEFAKRMSTFDFDSLVNNIIDWVDEDQAGRNGGDERSLYQDLQGGDYIPPNQPFKTLQELHMVKGMTDEIFNLLAPRVTVFGVKGVNVNYAGREVLMGLDSTMTDEAVDELLKRRADPNLGGPFKSEQEFYDFLAGFSVNVDSIKASKIPLYFADSELNFRIRSTGQYANVVREITAITYDYDNLVERYITMMNTEDQNQNNNNNDPQNPQTPPANPPPGQPANQNNNNQAKTVVPKGKPAIVYWEEN